MNSKAASPTRIATDFIENLFIIYIKQVSLLHPHVYQFLYGSQKSASTAGTKAEDLSLLQRSMINILLFIASSSTTFAINESDLISRIIQSYAQVCLSFPNLKSQKFELLLGLYSKDSLQIIPTQMLSDFNHLFSAIQPIEYSKKNKILEVLAQLMEQYVSFFGPINSCNSEIAECFARNCVANSPLSASLLGSFGIDVEDRELAYPSTRKIFRITLLASCPSVALMLLRALSILYESGGPVKRDITVKENQSESQFLMNPTGSVFSLEWVSSFYLINSHIDGPIAQSNAPQDSHNLPLDMRGLARCAIWNTLMKVSNGDQELRSMRDLIQELSLPPMITRYLEFD